MVPYQISPVSRVTNFIDFYTETKAHLSLTERETITAIEDELMRVDAINDQSLALWRQIVERLCNVALSEGIAIPLEFPQITNGMTTEASLEWYCLGLH